MVTLALVFCGVLSAQGSEEHPFFRVQGYPAWSKMTAEQLQVDMTAALEETQLQLNELNSVTPEAATFENTFVAYARQADNLLHVQGYAEHLLNVRPDEALKQAQLQGLSRITRFVSENAANFRLNKVMRAAAQTPWAQELDADQRYYMKLMLDTVRRMGADLTPEQMVRKSQIEEELLRLEKQFEQNLEEGYAGWKLVITDAAELAGLPKFMMQRAAVKARAAGLPQPAWLITLTDRLAEAVLVFCEVVETRRKCWAGYSGGGTIQQIDNEGILRRTFELRHELATLMGFRHYADLQAEQRMMGTAENALAFVDDMLAALKPAYDAEIADYLKKLETAKGSPLGTPSAWDIFYYTQRLPDEPGQQEPYMPAEKVLNGMLQLWSRLLGLDIRERETAHVAAHGVCPEGKVEVWHPDVRVFEVRNAADGVHLGSFYLDLYPRVGKRMGCWCVPLQFADPGPQGKIREPNLAAMVTNITPPVGGTLHLLSSSDVHELFHESGHLLHMLLGHSRLPGTPSADVEPDFVEVPSLLAECWLGVPEVLASLASYSAEGKLVTVELARQIIAAGSRRKVEPLVRSLCLAKLDLELNMHYHDKYRNRPLDEVAAELLAPWRIPCSTPEPCELRSTTHCMSSLYAASYYTYAWSEAMAADIFTRFKAEGALNPATGAAYRKAILNRGSSRPAADMFRDFMGRAPDPAALIEQYTGRRK